MGNPNDVEYTLKLTKDERDIILAMRRLNDGIIDEIERHRKPNRALVEAVGIACDQSYGDAWQIKKACDALLEKARCERMVARDAYYKGYFGKDKEGITDEDAR